MSTNAEIEVCKEQIRMMPASKKKGEAIYKALQLWIPIQEKADWLRLLNDKTGKLNQREIAAELCATDNIWKTERFRKSLDRMNNIIQENGYVKSTQSKLSDDNNSLQIDSKSEGNPIKELADLRLRTKLQLTEGKLHQAKIRITHLERELKKYTELSELNRAIGQLMKTRR